MSLEFIPAARPLIGAEERAAVDAVLAGQPAPGPAQRRPRAGSVRERSCPTHYI